jgi:RNA polymerase sigma factor (sigma-70 family)
MANLLTTAVARQLGSLFEGGSVVGLSDRQLLERFNAQPDETAQAAFEALVSRHGPMVLGICRQSLGDLQHAEDAFQAVFFVLARRARSIQNPDLLGNWLYGVALRTARKSKRRLSRQLANEANAAIRREEQDSRAIGSAEETAIAREHAQALYHEIARLPFAFRSPVVLCYFEGLSLDEAAQRLGCPAGTVHSRLDRARNKLRRGLIRRGIVLSGTALAGMLEAKAEWAAISPSLADIATRGAMRFANRNAVAGVLSASATTLAHFVLRSMVVKKLALAAIALLFLGTLTTVGLMGPTLARPAQLAQPPNRQAGKPDIPQNPKADDAEPKPAVGRMFVVGHVLDPNGKPMPGAAVAVYARTRLPGRLPSIASLGQGPLGDDRTDAAGRFRIDSPRTSSTTHEAFGAVALAPGYGAGWVALDVGNHQPTADITLRPEKVVHGRVFDLHGKPVPNVMLAVASIRRLLPQEPAKARGRLDGVAYSFTKINETPAWPKPMTTDAEGRYTLRGLGPETGAVLIVHHPRFALQRIQVDTNVASDSKPLTAALVPAQILTGRVIYADTGKGAPHAPLHVMASHGTLRMPADFETDGEGRFRLNPPPADRSFFITAYPPAGQPYLAAEKGLEWPKGSLEQSFELALPRGVSIYGKVTEEGAGKPVSGANVIFIAHAVGQGRGSPVETAVDGSFQIGVVASPGHLVVRAPSDDYVLREIGEKTLQESARADIRNYAHSFQSLELKPGIGSQEVNVVLRRGTTVTGEVVGPDGQPVREAWIFTRGILAPTGGATRRWSARVHGTTHNGRFELFGLDPDTEIAVYFLEPKRKLGIAVKHSGKSAVGEPVSVRLEPCGVVKARIVDSKGKAVTGPILSRSITLILTPGPHYWATREKAGVLAADQADLTELDPVNYPRPHAFDSQGRLTLPFLIPGATYRWVDYTAEGLRENGPPIRKEFTVKPGETLDLGDILIEKPASEAEATP